MVGAHPDDEDTFLIAWLSRGRHVQTAYLSLTRGDGGQNVIGNELGEALGVLRTEELLAARRVDGALQYFTRAFDFGFSKDTVDTYRHWPKDTILGDVVRVVRAFRPHVIVAAFSGTPRDGHGQHQVAGLLARDAYDHAADTIRFPVAAFGPPWTTLKFYRAARGDTQAGTLGMDVGEYSPLRGESYGEIAGRSRSQHKSQGFGALERKGPLRNYVRREASRVNAAMPASAERSIFDGIDTTWRRFRAGAHASWRAAFDSLPRALLAARQAFDPFNPGRLTPALARVMSLLDWICPSGGDEPCGDDPRYASGSKLVSADLFTSVHQTRARVGRALLHALGIAVEATAPRELFAAGSSAAVSATVYNRGQDTVFVSTPTNALAWRITGERMLPPGGLLHDTLRIAMDSLDHPWWLSPGRSREGAVFRRPASRLPEQLMDRGATIGYNVHLEPMQLGEGIAVRERIVHRFADDVRGEVRRPIAVVPPVSVSVSPSVQYVPADTLFERDVVVSLAPVEGARHAIAVSLRVPPGLVSDSATRVVSPAGTGAHGGVRSITFKVRGRVPAGRSEIRAEGATEGAHASRGYQLIDYEHIRPQRVFRDATVLLVAVNVRVPAHLRVAYVPGVSDNVAPMLAQLGVPVTVIAPDGVAAADLSRFTTVVVGPRAYEAHPALVAANARLLEFARRGGTLVVQYGQYEMTQPGIMPYPITISRPHDRVTHEDAPVTLLDPAARVLRFPNRITDADFAGWVQERSLYMPRSFDDRYAPVMAMSDPGEPANRAAILVAPLGSGRYIYTTLAFFRQLPAGVPGAARLFVNLLSAGPAASPSPR